MTHPPNSTGWTSPSQKALFMACSRGNTQSVRELLAEGADVLTCTRDGFTCLHIAAFLGHVLVVNLLLEEYKDSPTKCLTLLDRKTSSEKFTVLHMAACGKHDVGETIAATLLQNYMNSMLRSKGLATDPKKEYEIDDQLWLDYLLQIRDDLNSQDDSEISQHVIVEKLESYGTQARFGLPLKLKLPHHYNGLVRSFAKLLSFSNARDRIGRTALHYASWENKAELVKLLMWVSHDQLPGLQNSKLGSVASVNAMDMDGYTPLHFAAQNDPECTDVVIELFKANTGPQMKEIDFDLTTRQIRLVTKIYVNPNAAAEPTGRSQRLAAEIDFELDMLVPSRLGWSELLPRPNLQKLVWVENRASVTPLHYAVENSHKRIVQSLLEHPEIDVFQCSSDGQSPWTIALSSRDGDMVRLLRSGNMESFGTSLTGDIVKSYRRKLVEQVAKLAKEAEGNPDSDAADDLLKLEKQIFVTFVEDRRDQERHSSSILSSILGIKSFQLKPQHSTWKKISERMLNSNSDLKGSRFTLLHVAACEGYERELTKLLSLKRYKECINVGENLTSSGHTALHFAILRSTVDTKALAVLLKEKTLHLTKVNKQHQTPLLFVESLLEHNTFSFKLQTVHFVLQVYSTLTNLINLIFFGVFQLLDNLHLLSSERTDILKARKELRHAKRFENSKPFERIELESLREARRLLMNHKEVQQSMADLHKHRDLYVKAANAILVGAALIANISYTAMTTAGAGVDILSIASFSAAVAAVLTGAAAVQPSHSSFIGKEMLFVRMLLFLSSAFLGLSIYTIGLAIFIQYGGLNAIWILFEVIPFVCVRQLFVWRLVMTLPKQQKWIFTVLFLGLPVLGIMVLIIEAKKRSWFN